jgi:hypothetical protein
MLDVLSSGGKNVFFGVLFVIVSVILLISGLGFLGDRFYFFGGGFDLYISFACLIFGLAMIYSEVDRPRKPKFEIVLEEKK